MTQNLETFYGMQVRPLYDIELSSFDSVSAGLREEVEKIDLGQDSGFGIFVSRLSLQKTRHAVFGVSDLGDRLAEVNLRFKVTRKNQLSKKLFFLNHRVEKSLWLFSSDIRPNANMYDISASLPGSWCTSESFFEMIVVTAVHKSLQSRFRKIEIHATASPTDGFKQKFRNSDGVFTTKLNYNLWSSVQLALEFPGG